jgi:hypothetical protein
MSLRSSAKSPAALSCDGSRIINTHAEVEEPSGSEYAEGGVLGVSCNVTNHEKEDIDFESALRRYEKKVNKIHDYDR